MLDTIYNLTIWENPIWNYTYLGNAVRDYALAFGYFIVFLIIFKIFQSIIIRQLSALADKTKTDIDDELIKIVKSIKPTFYSFLAFYIAVNFIELNEVFRKFITVILIAWVVYQVIISLQILIDNVLKKYTDRDNEPVGAIKLIGEIAKALLWFVGALLVLSNLGVNITSLIAGLGIGGLAIALALKNILSDLFSSFAIHFDKPFVVGDYIIIGDKAGTVEKIGIKSTRLKVARGEELIISNQELTNAQVLNFKKMQERRIAFAFGVTYKTKQEQLVKIPNIIKETVSKVDGARFDRAHFKKISDSSLDFEVVYYITTPGYSKYMDIQQEINLKIHELFEKEKIEFAYPTQTLYIEK